MVPINEAIFRDYDVRGLVDKDLDDDFAELFGKAFGTWLYRKGTPDCLVGYDARESSPGYYERAVKGLLSTGINVVKIGMVTSPMMYWARIHYKIDGGLAVTASHNPPEYNGFKPASGFGTLFGQSLQDLKDLVIAEDFVSGEGKVSEKEIFEDYADDIASKVKLARPLSVIVDCGNATASPFAPAVFEKLGARVEKLFCDIDFSQPNHPPNPQDPRAYPQIQEKIRSGQYDLGLLFDGDADRLGAVDGEGNIVWGDQITGLCARKILEDKPGSLILFELQCSKSAVDDVVNRGGRYQLIRVGHSYIKEAIRITPEAQLAGEISGHLFFIDRWYGFDDAIYAAARLLEYVAASGKSLKDSIESMPKYIASPLTRIFAPDDRKFAIVEELKGHFEKKGLKVLTIDGVRLEWDDGWAVVRASNTQPQLTLRAEATTQNRLKEIEKIVEDALAPYEKEGVKLVWGNVAHS